MFNRTKKKQQQEEYEQMIMNQQMIQSPVQQQVQQSKPLPFDVTETKTDDKQYTEIKEEMENLTVFIQEQTKVMKEMAGRIEAIEENRRNPVLSEMSDTRRLVVLEQNVLTHQTTIDALVEAFNNITVEVNKLLNHFQPESKESEKKSKKKKHKIVQPDDEANLI